MDTKSDFSLPFSSQKQLALLGHALSNPTWQLQHLTGIDASWFHDPLVFRCWKMLSDLQTTLGRAVTPGELLCSRQFEELDPLSKPQLRALVSSGAPAAANQIGLDLLDSELPTLQKSAVIRSALPKVAEEYNRGTPASLALAIETLSGALDRLDDVDNRIAGRAPMNVEQFLAQPNPKPQKHLWGPLYTQQLTYIYGAAGASKTWLFLTLAEKVIARGGRVLWLIEEGTVDAIQFRLRTVGIKENLAIRHKTHFRLDDPQAVRGLIREAVSGQYDLICLDPLSNMVTADDSDQTAMRLVDTQLQKIRDESGACLVVVHHGTKASATRNGTFSLPDMANMRGSGVLQGSADLMLEVRRDTETAGHSHVSMTKNRDSSHWPGSALLILGGSPLTAEFVPPEEAKEVREGHRAVRVAAKEIERENEIIAHVKAFPGATANSIIAAVGGSRVKVLATLKNLVESKKLVCSAGANRSNLYSIQ